MSMGCGTLATGMLGLLLHILGGRESGCNFLFVDARDSFLEESAATTAMAWSLPISPTRGFGEYESGAWIGHGNLSKLDNRSEAKRVEVVLPFLCERN